MVNFPTPVGGTPLHPDLAPSILFAVLYGGVIVPLIIYRATNRRSRTILLTGASIFSFERTVFFTLRALQANGKLDPTGPTHGVTVYMQNSLAMGFIGIANDLVNILRCLLINPTYGSDMFFQSPAARTKGSVLGPPEGGTEDKPGTRKRIRVVMGLLGPAFLAASVPGILANANYGKALRDQDQADKTAKLRIISTALVIPMAMAIVLSASWGLLKLPRITKRGVTVLYCVVALIMTVSIYRLAVMEHKLTSLSDPNNPLNKNGAKAAFYIFHALPEWFSVLILFGNNVRQTFGTGPFGDWHFSDETEKQRRKREGKQEEKERKRGTILKLNTASAFL